MLSLVFVSASSFYAGAPNAQPPLSAANHPRLCNFDELYALGFRDFEDFESCNVGLLRACKLDKIYQLGDSISAVGNLIREVPMRSVTPLTRLPYGLSFPMGPTGNLLIDYFAMDASLPLLPPFKKRDADFSHSVNFTVGGATALTWNVPEAMNISTSMTTNSMSEQVDWMCAYFNSICQNQIDCGGSFENAIFVFGPFGGSDYHNATFQGKLFQEIETTLAPKVVDSIMAIMATVRGVVSLGAKKSVVPGIYTIFYLPIYRKTFPEETCSPQRGSATGSS